MFNRILYILLFITQLLLPLLLHLLLVELLLIQVQEVKMTQAVMIQWVMIQVQCHLVLQVNFWYNLWLQIFLLSLCQVQAAMFQVHNKAHQLAKLQLYKVHQLSFLQQSQVVAVE